MIRAELVSCLNLADMNTLVLAGGRNRCWWRPRLLVGTSAGAAVATGGVSW